ncbi:MAG TPA: peptide deformylase [Syntrophorhabdaceae bacterium]|nr:peptide deformylase [Syntrophorhabdaceae bacterium]HQM82147.1 peptide deformylase [Syntrophorhabdaceae bacterium]
MAFIEIRTIPDPVLRKISSPVANITDEITRLSEDMIETMKLSNGAGLAANQVGFPIRLITIDEHVNKQGNRHIILINPEIVEADSEETAEEGCLSVPNFYEYVKRAKKVLARGVSLEGETIELECEGQLARALQHEIDHLNGVLFIDHLSPVKKNLFKKKYQKRQ